MAYVPDNLVLCCNETMGGFWKIWHYQSTDAKATVAAASYISDAAKKGVKVGEVVFVLETDTNAISIHRVTAVASTGATLSAGLDIT